MVSRNSDSSDAGPTWKASHRGRASWRILAVIASITLLKAPVASAEAPLNNPWARLAARSGLVDSSRVGSEVAKRSSLWQPDVCDWDSELSDDTVQYFDGEEEDCETPKKLRARQLPPSDAPSGEGPNLTDLPSVEIVGNPYLPSYAIQYSPILYLDESETYWPGAWDFHLSHLFPVQYGANMTGYPQPLTLENCNWTVSNSIYMSQNNLAEQPYPDWWHAYYGKPDSTGYSGGNVTVIAVNKTESVGPGVVDVFYILFYSFNLGDEVGGQVYGNHLSDIEHLMIRFYDGVPRYIFLSQHNDGQAYEWEAMQFEGQRPIVYVSAGGHANYPVAGTFNLVPNFVNLVYDSTSASFRWDMALNYNGYWFSQDSGFVTAGGKNASTQPHGPPGVGYLQQLCKWGNAQLPASDPNQVIILGEHAWSDGATGPADPSKAIDRVWLCVTTDCVANASLPASSDLQAGQNASMLATSGALISFAFETRTLICTTLIVVSATMLSI